jgi:6,7-dimethyl-8-ribityllumazine synthase
MIMAQSSNSNTLLDISDLMDLKDISISIIATQWNERIVAEQIAGARSIAMETGAIISNELYVPGCFELPFAAKCLFDKTKDRPDAVDAIIVFGAVIRGGTPHFEYVCKAVTEGILQLNINLPIPVIFGVLTLDSEDQAWERLGGPYGHKGAEAMIAALKMVRFRQQI